MFVIFFFRLAILNHGYKELWDMKKVAAYVLSCTFAVVVVFFLVLECYLYAKSKSKQKPGIEKTYLFDSTDTGDTSVSGYYMRECLSMLPFATPRSYRTYSENVVYTSFKTLEDNLCLRTLADSLCVLLRNRMRMSSRTCAIRGLDHYCTRASGDTATLQLKCLGITCYALVSGAGSVSLHHGPHKTEHSAPRDALLVQVNRFQPALIDVSFVNDIYVFRFGATACLT